MKKEKKPVFPSDLEDAQGWLTDKARLNKGSRSMLNAIVYLQKTHPNEVQNNTDLI